MLLRFDMGTPFDPGKILSRRVDIFVIKKVVVFSVLACAQIVDRFHNVADDF